MRPSGRVNVVSLVLILALIIGVWLAVHLSKPYLDNLNVKDSVASAYSDVLLGRTDEQIRNRIIEELNGAKVGTHKEYNGYGELVEVPGLGLTAENITIERDDVRRTVRIRIEYDREVKLSPLAKVITLHFNPEKKGPSIRE